MAWRHFGKPKTKYLAFFVGVLSGYIPYTNGLTDYLW